MSSIGSDADQANTNLRSAQFQFVTSLNRLRDNVSRLGTHSDTTELRKRVATSSEKLKQLALDFRTAAEAHPAKDTTAAQKIIRDFQGLLRSYERLMATARQKEATHLPTPSSSRLSSSSQQQQPYMMDDREEQALLAANQLQQQRQQQLNQVETELVFNEAVILERDAAIAEITSQIGEVGQIFQDLAVLVNDQGEMLDDIEANISRAGDRVGDATGQLVRAERSQRRARQGWCFLFLLAAGVFGILFLILLA
jgi:syntaxin 7